MEIEPVKQLIDKYYNLTSRLNEENWEECKLIMDKLNILGYHLSDMGIWYDPNHEKHLDELDFEFGDLYAYNNHDYRCMLSYELGCGRCPPNRNENANHHHARNRLRGRPKPEWDNPGQSKSKGISKDRNKGRKFKKLQTQLQLSEDEDI